MRKLPLSWLDSVSSASAAAAAPRCYCYCYVDSQLQHAPSYERMYPDALCLFSFIGSRIGTPHSFRPRFPEVAVQVNVLALLRRAAMAAAEVPEAKLR